MRAFLFLEHKIFADEARSFEKAHSLVRLSYAVLVYYSFYAFVTLDWQMARPHFSPIWSLTWAHYVPYEIALNAVRFFFLGGMLLGAHLYRHRAARIVAFLALFQYVSFENSFGGINPGYYPLLYPFFWFLFLPDIPKSEMLSGDQRKSFLLVFWITQLFALAAYTMSGIGKLYDAAGDILAGRDITVFSPYALAYYIADWIPRLQREAILSDFFIDHPLLGFPVMLFTLYLFMFSAWVAFRPLLHRMWALLLIIFHIMVHLTMALPFSESILVLLLLFYDSPFQRPAKWQEVLAHIPPFEWIGNRLKNLWAYKN